MATKAELEIINAINLGFKKWYTENTGRNNYFLTACILFYNRKEITYDIALNLRLYGGLIDNDNSSLNNISQKSGVLEQFYTTQWVCFS